MQFSTIIIAAFAATGLAAPLEARAGQVNPAQVPQFGVQKGVSPDGTGNCKGLNNKNIPCFCPPDREAFIQKVQQFVGAGNALGTPVSFPSDNSAASQRARIETAIVTLQNFNGTPGVGCPAVSTTFVQQLQAVQG